MRVTSDDGQEFEVGEPLAEQSAHDDCQDPRCTRMDGVCIGWHCPYCGEPCSSQGHYDCPQRP